MTDSGLLNLSLCGSLLGSEYEMSSHNGVPGGVRLKIRGTGKDLDNKEFNFINGNNKFMSLQFNVLLKSKVLTGETRSLEHSLEEYCALVPCSLSLSLLGLMR